MKANTFTYTVQGEERRMKAKLNIYTTFAELRAAEACKPRYRFLANALGGIRGYGKDTPISILTILETNGIADAERAMSWCPSLKLLYDDYREKLEPLYDDYREKLKALAGNWGEFNVLESDYAAKLKALYDEYAAKRKALLVRLAS